MSDNKTICYLCGKQIVEDGNEDHVPPKQFFGKELRRQLNPDLTTLHTHKKCNSSFQLDEEYFVASLMPLIQESESGRSIYNDVKRRYDRGKNVGLVSRVYEEFDSNPSGLILPNDKILKRFDRTRINRIIWKITRGLYYIENCLLLPEETNHKILYTFPGEEPPKWFVYLKGMKGKSNYPDVFDYLYLKETQDITGSIWVLLLWNQIITTTLFHDITCTCQRCIKKSSKKTNDNSPKRES